MAAEDPQPESDQSYPAVVRYGTLKQVHPRCDEKFWKTCRALYAGGPALLADDEVMQEIFPQGTGEDSKVYAERRKRAYYLNYPGEILDAIVASLTANPVTMLADPKPAGPEQDFYEDFFTDVSPPGGRRQSLGQLLRDQILVALQCQTAWTLVDLPTPDELDEIPPGAADDLPAQGYANLGDQQAAGALRAYACPVAPENVRDWEEDDSGELNWVLIRTQEQKREGIAGTRERVKEIWTYYDREGWARYELIYKTGHPPADSTEVLLAESGPHSFGRVPMARLSLPDGLAAMKKISSVAIAHFNARNALEWAKIRALMPTPVAFLGAADPMNPITEDDRRALQPHSVTRMRVLGDKDRLEYVGPDSTPFAFAGEDLATLRDEMHRVLHHMALSVDNSGAALQRSADSKAIDQAVAAVVLAALGAYGREHAEDIYELVEDGRGDEERVWTAQGMDDFSDTTAGQMIEEAVNLATIEIPSATFQTEYKFGLSKKILGPQVSLETLEKIRKELEGNITPEHFETEAGADLAVADKQKRQAEAAPDDPTANMGGAAFGGNPFKPKKAAP